MFIDEEVLKEDTVIPKKQKTTEGDVAIHGKMRWGRGVGSIQADTFPPRWISWTGGDKIFGEKTICCTTLYHSIFLLMLLLVHYIIYAS